jgi:rhomboid protease GluP
VSYALIAANVGMFAFELARGAGLGGPTAEEMIGLGGDLAALACHGQSWRLLSAMFLHYGLIHLGLNMLCLYQIRFVERMLGHAEFLALYLAAGLVGGLASLAVHPNAVSAGASGAVFGMFGAFTAVMFARRKRVDPDRWNRTMRSLGMFFAINLVYGLAERGIDLSAHVGGVGVGLVGGFVLAKTASPTARRPLRALLVAVLGAGIAFGGLYLLPG